VFISLGAAPASFVTLFVAVFAFNLFRSPLSQMADVAALEHPGDYGRLRAFGSIGFMIAAPAVGRWVPLDPAWCLPATCAAGLGCAIVTSFLLPKRAAVPRTGITNEARSLLRNRSFLLLLATAALGQAAHAAYDLCISMHLSDLGASGTVVGVAWALATAGEIVLMSISAWLFAKNPATLWYVLSLAVGIGRWLLFAWVKDPQVLLLTQPIHGMTFGMRWVSSLSLLKSFAGVGTMGTAQGLFMASYSLGGVVGMVAWGPLFARFGGSWVFLGAALVGAVALIAGMLLHIDLSRPASSPHVEC
jgi:PPP family 3-phenylpropionic acid transporter